MVRISPRAIIRNAALLFSGTLLWSIYSSQYMFKQQTRNEETKQKLKTEERRQHCKECGDYTKWNYTWDGGPADFRGHHTEVRWRSLYFVRHGNYHSNGEKAGHLTDIGMKQAQLVAERLVSLGLNFSRLETSTSPRAIETANIIETKLREFKSPVSKFQPNPDLREGWPTMPQPTALYPKRTGKDIEWEIPRLAKAFTDVFKRPPKGHYSNTGEMYVCHGNIISYFVLRSLQVPIERFLRLTVHQASITVIDFNSKGLFKVKMVGDVGHLPMDLWT